MSATYSFLPWLRQGIANQISGQSGQRATISLELTLRGTPVNGGAQQVAPPHLRKVEIYGPGDVVGIEPRAIIKSEPQPYLTNFEPNYLAYIDFYDEDFAWRYSPVTPNGHRLTPWLALIVLKEDEFKDGKSVKDRPLPYVLTNAATKLPPPAQLWAWAHVHLNTNVAGSEVVSDDADAIQAKVAQTLNDLGTLVERAVGSLRFLLLVLVMAAVSNVVQFKAHGPLFGGMSGVVYGLFGYAWIRGRLDPTSGLYLRQDIVFWMLGWFVLCAAGVIGGVANWAHGGGLASGAALGYLAYTLDRMRRRRR
jgi:hypothetical protein